MFPALSFVLNRCLTQDRMTTLLDHKTTLAYLAYLGYPSSIPSSSPLYSSATPQTVQNQTTALQITSRSRRKSQVSRNVFLAYVCGAAGSGKTSLLKAFASREFVGGRGGRGAYEPTRKIMCVVNGVQIGGREKYLVVCFRDLHGWFLY